MRRFDPCPLDSESKPFNALRFLPRKAAGFVVNKPDGDDMLDTAQRVHLITRYCEEVIGADELPGLLDQGLPLRHYIGLEISGRLHVGTGLACMQKVRDLQVAGLHCTHFLPRLDTLLKRKT